jgi:diacylglycerol kinase (ATP)
MQSREGVARRSLAVVNPNSSGASIHASYLQWFEQLGGLTRAVRSDIELTEVAREAIRIGRERLIVVGGDGSISRFANLEDDSVRRLETAIVPAGTGNDLGRALGVPIDDPQRAWEIALSGTVREVDLVALNGTKRRRFVNSVTGGFGGRQAADTATDQKSYLGKIAYWLAALSQLGGMPEFELLLQMPDREISLRCFGFWLANGQTVGGGFPVAPTAFLDDGLLDVVVIPALSTLDLLEAGLDLTLTGPEPSEQILTCRTSDLRLITAPSVPLSIDGDPEETRYLECRVLPRILRMVAGVSPALGNGVAASPEERAQVLRS